MVPPFSLELTPDFLQHPPRPYLTQPLASPLFAHRAPSRSRSTLLPGVCVGRSPAWGSSPTYLLGSLPRLLPGFERLPLPGEACPAHPPQRCEPPPTRPACPGSPLPGVRSLFL